MEHKRLTWRVATTATPVRLLVIGDCHVGARDFDRKLFQATIRAASVRDDTAVVLLGDEIDAIAHRDKRFAAEGIDRSYPSEAFDNLPMHELHDFQAEALPIRGKVVAACKGNHGAGMVRQGDLSVDQELARWLGFVESAEFSMGSCSDGPVDLQFGGHLLIRFVAHGERPREVRFYLHHGWRGGKTGSIAAWLESLVKEYAVDCAIVGHGHTPVVVHTDRVDPATGKVKRGVAMMIPSWRSPALRKGWAAWEDMKGFAPRTHGPALLTIYPATGRIDAVFGRDALEALREEGK